MKTPIKIKHAHETPAPGDGTRFLVDRLCPRGLKKEALQLEAWVREAAPSTELRKWFNHEPEKWSEFRRRYFAELSAKPEGWAALLYAARKGTITLLFGAHDSEHNNAVALAEFLQSKLKPRTICKANPAFAKDGGHS